MRLATFAALFFCLAGLMAEDGQPPVLDAMNLDLLRENVGAVVTVEGMVTTVGSTKNNSITFINVGLPKKQGFVAVIFERSYGAFPNGFDAYYEQKVRVTGKLELYQGNNPQIEVKAPDQIEVVKAE